MTFYSRLYLKKAVTLCRALCSGVMKDHVRFRNSSRSPLLGGSLKIGGLAFAQTAAQEELAKMRSELKSARDAEAWVDPVDLSICILLFCQVSKLSFWACDKLSHEPSYQRPKRRGKRSIEVDCLLSGYTNALDSCSSTSGMINMTWYGDSKKYCEKRVTYEKSNRKTSVFSPHISLVSSSCFVAISSQIAQWPAQLSSFKALAEEEVCKLKDEIKNARDAEVQRWWNMSQISRVFCKHTANWAQAGNGPRRSLQDTEWTQSCKRCRGVFSLCGLQWKCMVLPSGRAGKTQRRNSSRSRCRGRLTLSLLFLKMW